MAHQPTPLSFDPDLAGINLRLTCRPWLWYRVPLSIFRQLSLLVLLAFLISGCGRAAREQVDSPTAPAVDVIAASEPEAVASKTQAAETESRQVDATTTPVISLTATITASLSPTVTLTTTPCPIPDGWSVHVIQPGDTLSYLAVWSGTTVEDLKRTNCLQADDIVINDYLFVPVTLQPTATTCVGSSDWSPYTVQPGDTLSELASAAGTSPEEVKRANCRESDDLRAGEELLLPVAPPTSTPTTLASAARRTDGEPAEQTDTTSSTPLISSDPVVDGAATPVVTGASATTPDTGGGNAGARTVDVPILISLKDELSVFIGGGGVFDCGAPRGGGEHVLWEATGNNAHAVMICLSGYAEGDEITIDITGANLSTSETTTVTSRDLQNGIVERVFLFAGKAPDTYTIDVPSPASPPPSLSVQTDWSDIPLVSVVPLAADDPLRMLKTTEACGMNIDNIYQAHETAVIVADVLPASRPFNVGIYRFSGNGMKFDYAYTYRARSGANQQLKLEISPADFATNLPSGGDLFIVSIPLEEGYDPGLNPDAAGVYTCFGVKP